MSEFMYVCMYGWIDGCGQENAGVLDQAMDQDGTTLWVS